MKYKDYLTFHPWTYPAGKEHDNCEERFKKIIEGLKAQLTPTSGYYIPPLDVSKGGKAH